MNFTKQVYTILFLFVSVIAYSQEVPIVAVDGYFINLSKEEFLKDFNENDIVESFFIEPDSACVFMGDYGKGGLDVIQTRLPKRVIMKQVFPILYFKANPEVFINDKASGTNGFNSVNPELVDSIIVVPPLKAVMKYGMKKVGGVIRIYAKE